MDRPSARARLINSSPPPTDPSDETRIADGCVRGMLEAPAKNIVWVRIQILRRTQGRPGRGFVPTTNTTHLRFLLKKTTLFMNGFVELSSCVVKHVRAVA